MWFGVEFWFHLCCQHFYLWWHCIGTGPLSLLIMMSSLGIILYINWLITFWYSFCCHNAFWCAAFILLFILFCTSIYVSSHCLRPCFCGPVKAVNMNYFKEFFSYFEGKIEGLSSGWDFSYFGKGREKGGWKRVGVPTPINIDLEYIKSQTWQTCHIFWKKKNWTKTKCSSVL